MNTVTVVYAPVDVGAQLGRRTREPGVVGWVSGVVLSERRSSAAQQRAHTHQPLDTRSQLVHGAVLNRLRSAHVFIAAPALFQLSTRGPHSIIER